MGHKPSEEFQAKDSSSWKASYLAASPASPFRRRGMAKVAKYCQAQVRINWPGTVVFKNIGARREREHFRSTRI